MKSVLYFRKGVMNVIRRESRVTTRYLGYGEELLTTDRRPTRNLRSKRRDRVSALLPVGRRGQCETFQLIFS